MSSMSTSTVNLLDSDRKTLEGFFSTMAEKPFRASQVLQWVHQYGVTDFAQMTNLSLALRAKLAGCAEIKLPKVALRKVSRDGTRKWLFRFDDGNCIETVFIPEKNRGTLCISSQVGCPLDCQFCSTGKQGFSRNLTVGEIIGQLWTVVRELSGNDRAILAGEKIGCISKKAEEGEDFSSITKERVTNVVMMGMGEPLLNFDSVVKAMNIMMDDYAYGLSKYKVTLSTSGLVPAMEKLREVSNASLAVSLHAPNDELRTQLMPINKKYKLNMLMDICRRYFKDEPRRMVMFEYVMLDKVNDQPEHAKQLIKLLNGVPSKVNLIPFNAFPHADYRCSSQDSIKEFQRILMSAGVSTIIRKTRGEDINAACGQLVGNVIKLERTSSVKQ